jgi:hypothetical protein
MVTIRYIGRHQAQETIDVEAVKAQQLLDRGDYILVEDHTGIITDVVVSKTKETKKSLKTNKKED